MTLGVPSQGEVIHAKFPSKMLDRTVGMVTALADGMVWPFCGLRRSKPAVIKRGDSVSLPPRQKLTGA
jgi:hypothetical protein